MKEWVGRSIIVMVGAIFLLIELIVLVDYRALFGFSDILLLLVGIYFIWGGTYLPWEAK